MAFEADRVVVELIAKVDQFDTPLKSSAQSFDSSMNKIASSATKAEAAVTRSAGNRAKAIERESAQISQFAKALARDMDFAGAHLTGPKSPFVVPAKEAPKVSNALKLVSVGAASMAGVLGGIAVTATFALVDALGDLILKGGGAKAEIDGMVQKLKEHAEKTDRAEQAQRIFGETLEGVTQAIREDEKALAALNNQHVTAARQALINAERRLLTLQGIRDETKATLDQARAELELQKARLDRSPGRGFEANVAQLQANASAIDALEAKLGKVDKLIGRQKGRITEALSFNAVEIGEKLADPVERINAKYADLKKAARERAVLEGTVRTTLVAQTAELEKQRLAEVKAAQARQRTDRSNQQSGRQISEAQARAIVAGLGGTVTSGTRSIQHNEDVGGVKGSFHTKGQALDIAKTAGLTLGKIVKAFEAQGVKLIEKLDEGDHFHIAWARRGGGRSGPSEETLARRAAAAAERAANREQAFDNEKAGLEGQVIDARQALVTAAEEIAQLELNAIEISRAKYADQVAHLQTVGKLQKDEAAELLKLNEERAALRKEAVLRREEERKFRMREAEIQRQQAIQSGGLQAQQELLQSQQGIARSQRERLEIGQRLVDLQFKEERLALEAAIAREARLKAEYARTKSQETLALLEQAEVDAAIARQRLGTIDQRQGAAQQGNAQANASPLQSYFGDIQAEADDLDSAFERIAAGGLQNFTDRLTDAIVNFRSLGDVGRQVLLGLTTDLVKLAIRLVLNATIGRLVGKIATVSTAAQMAAIAAAAAPAAALVSLATFGANSPAAIAGMAAANAAALGFAAAGAAAGVGGGAFREGGRIFGPGTSTSDSIPIRASANEFMIKAKSAQRVGYDALDYINRTGELPRYVTDADVARIRPSNVEARRPGGGSSGISEDALRRIEQAVERGAAAQTPVALYPTMNPREVVSAILGDPASQRELFNFFGNNSTRMNGAMRP